jgi:hypothetical protein
MKPQHTPGKYIYQQALGINEKADLDLSIKYD